MTAYKTIKTLPQPYRDDIFSDYLKNGGSPSNWNNIDKWTLCDSLTRAEDALEELYSRSSKQPKIDVRNALKTIRRVLEDELEESGSDWLNDYYRIMGSYTNE